MQLRGLVITATISFSSVKAKYASFPLYSCSVYKHRRRLVCTWSNRNVLAF